MVYEIFASEMSLGKIISGHNFFSVKGTYNIISLYFQYDSHRAHHVNIKESLQNLSVQIIRIFGKLQKDHGLESWVFQTCFSRQVIVGCPHESTSVCPGHDVIC